MARAKFLVKTLFAAIVLSIAVFAPSANAFELIDVCKVQYEKFLDWKQYYKVFAYGVGGGRAACSSRTGERAAIEACTRTLNRTGHQCQVYAKSPVNGKVAVIWNEYKNNKKISAKSYSLEPVGDDYSLCSYVTAASGTRWADETANNMRYREEARERQLTLKKCREILGNSTVSGVAAKREISQPATTHENSTITSLSNAEVCSIATYSTGERWAKNYRNDRQPYIFAAKQRGLSLSDCKILINDNGRRKKIAAWPQRNRDAIAVIIGNRNYKGRIHEVDFAHNDAEAMKRFVLDRLGYREGNVIDLRDASQAQMLAVFGNAQTHEGKLFNWVKPDKSDVAVFYSGHGVPGMRDRRAYLLPVDSDADHAEITGVPIDTLFANLAKIPAKSMTVYLDACFSGESPRGMIIRSTSGVNVTPKMPTSAGNMTVITAARGDQFASWDEKAKHGLFTKHLLEALEGAADGKAYGDTDGRVTLAEVQTYLDEEMTYQARRTWGRRQNASVRGDNDTALVYFTPAALTAAARPKPAAVAPVAKVKQTAIEEMHAIYTVISTANLRAGPSTNDQIIGGLAADSRIIVDGRVTGKNWYRLDDGSFIYGGLIKADD